MSTGFSIYRPKRNFGAAVRFAIQPHVLISSILASVALWLLTLTFAPAYAALIFQDRLVEYSGAIVGIVLISATVSAFVIGFFSSDASTIGCPQDTAIIIQAGAVSSLLMYAPAGMSDESLFITVVAAIALSSFLTGLFLLLMGAGHAGIIIRYIPYPVVDGLLAGVGWLLIRGALNIMVNNDRGSAALSMLFDGDVLIRWVPGLVLALFLFWLLRRVNNALFLPATILAALALCYGFIYLSGESKATLTGQGWFLASGGADLAITSSPLLHVSAISQIDVPLVLAQAGGMATLAVITIIHLLVNTSSQELMVNREMDTNRELFAAGAGNMLSSLLGGGAISFPCLSYTALVHSMGAYGRLVGLILALLLVTTLTFSGLILTLFPRFILGGLVMYLGITFISEWLYASWFKLSRQDYAVVLAIVLVIAFLGFLEGIIVGIIAAIILVILEYNRIGSIRQELSGGEHISNIERSSAEKRYLNGLGQPIWIMRLQGFIFFGTSHQFYQRVKARVQDKTLEALQFIILDFRWVHGIDVSTAIDFNKVRQLAKANGIRVLLSDVPPHVRDVLLTADNELRDSADLSSLAHTFDDLDTAIDWCESELLTHADFHPTKRVTVQEQFEKHAIVSQIDIGKFSQYLEPMKIEAGEVIAYQGGDSDSLYFIESGRVDILLQLDNNNVIRLRSMSAGTVVGEVGFHLGRPRSASIVVTEAGIVHKFSHEARSRMERDDPEAASAFHAFTSCVLSDRLTAANRMVMALMD